ncbi:hypothetical protein [Burkholderia latens]|uniref:hypothetical protein n=1 Tax=Burkholderia latens TaxID=488446 RepID=UPI0021BBD219|nr:hypothetical protein [Burkholderia latens]
MKRFPIPFPSAVGRQLRPHRLESSRRVVRRVAVREHAQAVILPHGAQAADQLRERRRNLDLLDRFVALLPVLLRTLDADRAATSSICGHARSRNSTLRLPASAAYSAAMPTIARWPPCAASQSVSALKTRPRLWLAAIVTAIVGLVGGHFKGRRDADPSATGADQASRFAA